MFEIARTANGYASTPTVLAGLFGIEGVSEPVESLVADANGDLFGTTFSPGTVFEVTKTADGYSSTPVAVTNFDGNVQAFRNGSLIADANGDLFGHADGRRGQ